MDSEKIKKEAKKQFQILFKGVPENNDEHGEWLEALFVNAFVRGVVYSLNEK